MYFTNYASTEKGYLCIDPYVGRGYVAMDVSFFESTPILLSSSRLSLRGVE